MRPISKTRPRCGARSALGWEAVRIERSHRVIGRREGNVFYRGWIGSHEAYNKLLRK
jgi:hypothetical protein